MDHTWEKLVSPLNAKNTVCRSRSISQHIYTKRKTGDIKLLSWAILMDESEHRCFFFLKISFQYSQGHFVDYYAACFICLFCPLIFLISNLYFVTYRLDKRIGKGKNYPTERIWVKTHSLVRRAERDWRRVQALQAPVREKESPGPTRRRVRTRPRSRTCRRLANLPSDNKTIYTSVMY